MHSVLFRKKHPLMMMYTCMRHSGSDHHGFRGEQVFVSYAPFQNLEFDDESLDDLKRIELVEKPLEEQEFVGTSVSSCVEKRMMMWGLFM